MYRALRRWFGRTPPGFSTRLRSEDALAIARATAVDQGERDSLTVVNLVQREGSAIWVVSTATIGLMLEVHVDDASGRVLERKWVGVR